MSWGQCNNAHVTTSHHRLFEPVVLLDGSSALWRIATRDDGRDLATFFVVLQEEAGDTPTCFPRWIKEDVDAASRVITHIIAKGVAGEQEVIAAGAWRVASADEAEITLAVHPEFRGRGLARVLLPRLARDAAFQGIRQLVAVTDRNNVPLIQLLRDSGYAVDVTLDGNGAPDESDVRIALDVAPDDEGRAMAALRKQVATTASLQPLLRPSSVAVVGASRDRSSIGYRILDALVHCGFHGPVYAVNPSTPVVGSFPTVPSLRDLPQPVDLAVVVVPARHVSSVVKDAAASGVRGLVVITAGFAEVGPDGHRAQMELMHYVRGHGMRMIGPNCMGLLNTDPAISMNASFSPVFPPQGSVAMLSQSGALGLAILTFASTLGVGLSSFVSIGNKADVSSNDLLEYWEADPATDVILLYLESFGNPRRFAPIARRVSRTKPIVAVKGGRSVAGERAAGSHTAALVGADVAVDALFRQAGVIRVDTLEEMFHVGLLLSNQPLPLGRRVGVITNAGGPAILAADALAAWGLDVPELSDAMQSKLAAFLPPEASTKNPVDMIASATPDAFRQAAALLLATEEIDALIVIDIPLDASGWEAIEPELLRGIDAGRAASPIAKPVLAYVMSGGGSSQPRLIAGNIPAFPFPESAAKALGHAVSYAEWRRRPLSAPDETTSFDAASIRAWCQSWLERYGDGWLPLDAAFALLALAGLPIATGARATTADEAEQAARSMPSCVAMKAISPGALHKSDEGGVQLRLETTEEVRRAFTEMQRAYPDLESVWIQPMVDDALEVLVGMTEDHVFGPLIAFGLGGIHVEALGDVAFRITPLEVTDAQAMLKDIRAHALLEGHRGRPPVDREALVTVLLSVARLVEDVPAIAEMDLNPVMALPQGCIVVDARIRLATPQVGRSPARL